MRMTYSGVTTVNDGTLIVGKASGLGTAAGATDNTTINADGTLTIRWDVANISTEQIILNEGTLRGMGTNATAGGTIMLTVDSDISAPNDTRCFDAIRSYQ